MLFIGTDDGRLLAFRANSSQDLLRLDPERPEWMSVSNDRTRVVKIGANITGKTSFKVSFMTLSEKIYATEFWLF